jgi:hypothetical protein
MKKTETSLSIFDRSQFEEFNTQNDRLIELERQRDALLESLRRSREEAERPQDIGEQADRLLGGEALSAVVECGPQVRLDIERLEREYRIVAAAVTKQFAIVERLKAEAQRKVREAARPRHVAIAKRMERAALDLYEAIMADIEFTAELDRGGVTFGDPLVRLDGFPTGLLYNLLKGKDGYGIGVPEDWRGDTPGVINERA